MRSTVEILDRLTVVFLFLFVLVQPYSIAATHIAYAGAALAWLARLALVRLRGQALGLRSSPLDLPILIYWVLCAVSATLTPYPYLSWHAMRAVGLVFVVLLVGQNLRSLDQARRLVIVLLVAGCGTALYTGWQHAYGIGLRVMQIDTSTPFYAAGMRLNDIIKRVDGRLLRHPEAFLAHLDAKPADEPLRLRVVHGEGDPAILELPAARLPRAATRETLGMTLIRARPFRAQSFYSQVSTYSEVMQMLAALAFGLWLGLRPRASRRPEASGLLLAVACALLALALLATLTRASWLSLILALAVMLALHARFGNARRRWPRPWRGWLLVALPVVLIVLAVGMHFALKSWRAVGLIDLAEKSTDYRILMWQDGLRLIQQHPLWGVGQNSIAYYWWDYDLAAYKKYGYRHHFHSTPMQIGVERGLLVLAAWVWLMAAIWWVAYRLVRQARGHPDPEVYGLCLGLLGATTGFLSSSLVHYNFGDSEVVLLFWFLAGLAVALRSLLPERQT